VNALQRKWLECRRIGPPVPIHQVVTAMVLATALTLGSVALGAILRGAGAI
jgi:hypothetical protein